MHLQLKEMMGLIEKIMQADFIKLSLEIPKENQAKEALLQDKEQLTPLITELLRINKFQIVIQAYKEAVAASIKDSIKKVSKCLTILRV
jgi:hypothetical protein